MRVYVTGARDPLWIDRVQLLCKLASISSVIKERFWICIWIADWVLVYRGIFLIAVVHNEVLFFVHCFDDIVKYYVWNLTVFDHKLLLFVLEVEHWYRGSLESRKFFIKALIIAGFFGHLDAFLWVLKLAYNLHIRLGRQFFFWLIKVVPCACWSFAHHVLHLIFVDSDDAESLIEDWVIGRLRSV